MQLATGKKKSKSCYYTRLNLLAPTAHACACLLFDCYPSRAGLDAVAEERRDEADDGAEDVAPDDEPAEVLADHLRRVGRQGHGEEGGG